jgi:hypothetical protein
MTIDRTLLDPACEFNLDVFNHSFDRRYLGLAYQLVCVRMMIYHLENS